MMFLPLVVLVNLSLGLDPAILRTPSKIYADCNYRMATLEAGQVADWEAEIAHERAECRATLIRAVPWIENRITVAKHDINFQKEIRTTARLGLIKGGVGIRTNLEILFAGETDTWKFFLDRVERIIARWMTLAQTDCTADLNEYMREQTRLSDDLKAFKDFSVISAEELADRVPLTAIHAAMEPMVRLWDGEWPLVESPKIRDHEARLVELQHQLAAAREFIAALST
jgi:hypothetical protein